MTLKKQLLFNLPIAAFLGVCGGWIFAVYDIGITVAALDIPLVSWWDLFRISVMPLVIHILFAATGMLLLILLATISLHTSNIRLKRSDWIKIIIIFTTFFVISAVVQDLHEYVKGLQRLTLFHSLLFGSLSSIAIWFLIQNALKKTGWKMIILTIPLIVFIFMINWYTLVWFVEHVPMNKDQFIYPERKVAREYPNILWIVLDTVRADHISSYGYHRPTTPNIDSFAKRGMLFTNAISPAPWTLPAHASMLTGLYPSEHGADGSWQWLGPTHKTLPQILQQHGFTTAAFSNNENFSANRNLHQGFDTFLYLRTDKQDKFKLMLAKNLEFFLRAANLPRQFMGMDRMLWWLKVFPLPDTGAQITNELVTGYINARPQNNQPFFVMINYMEAHMPHGVSPQADKYLTETGETYESARILSEEITGQIILSIVGKKVLSKHEKETITALYDGDITYLDTKVGELLDWFEKQELLQNTLVIITSDHGENLGDHGLLSHVYDIHRSLTHVPLIIYHPEKFTPGTVDDRLVQTIDLAPTLLHIIGIDEEIQGVAGKENLLAPRLDRNVVSEARFKEGFTENLVSVKEHSDVDPRKLGGVWKSVQNEEYEYIDNILDPHLYHIATDTAETQDLIEIKPDITSKMRNILSNWLLSLDHYTGPW